ncbi:hypothetical protein D3C76_488860 [compost metagenome]
MYAGRLHFLDQIARIVVQRGDLLDTLFEGVTAQCPAFGDDMRQLEVRRLVIKGGIRLFVVLGEGFFDMAILFQCLAHQQVMAIVGLGARTHLAIAIPEVRGHAVLIAGLGAVEVVLTVVLPGDPAVVTDKIMV